ncbi:MAG: flavin reductase family protein [Bacteroidota bacterium]
MKTTKTKTFDPNTLSPKDLHSLLLSTVAPRPICFASTVAADGNVNLSPFSYFNVFSSNPPVLAFSPTRSGRDNSLKHTHQNVLDVPEVVINMVNYDLVTQMSLASTAYAKGINEFIKSGLTEVPSELVTPPRVGEAPVAFECRVNQIIALAQTPGAGNLALCEVLRVHIDEDYLVADALDPTKLDLVGRMGGDYYVRASAAALFEVAKPKKQPGIGVDALPLGIRESNVLTGNNLGHLGSLAELPTVADLEAIAKDDEIQMMAHKMKANPERHKDQLHWLAQCILEEGDVHKALVILMYAERF